MPICGTAGAAFADVKANLGPCPGSCAEKSRGGWTAGVGLEGMFAPNWSAKIEYLHYDLGESIHYSAGIPITALDRGDIVRAGINYHFDFANLLHLF